MSLISQKKWELLPEDIKNSFLHEFLYERVGNLVEDGKLETFAIKIFFYHFTYLKMLFSLALIVYT